MRSKGSRGLQLVVLLAFAAVALASAFVYRESLVPEGHVGLKANDTLVPAGARWPLVKPMRATGSVAGTSSAPSKEGALVAIAWKVEWSVRMDASRDVVRGWARDAPPDVTVPPVVEAAWRETAQEHAGDELLTAGVLALAEADARKRLRPLGLDAGVRFTDPSQGEGSLRAKLRETRWPVVLVGVDGMDWRIVKPLLDAGRMPNFAALVARGARADLRSARPMLSPLLWTTMATGRRPEDHGVCDFLAVDPADGRRVPITSAFRRVPALWNVAGEAGLDSAFVGWWATWPAEPVRGVMVSDRLSYSLADAGASPAARLAFPPAFQARALALRIGPEAVDAPLVARFTSAPASDERVAHLRRMLAGALTYHAVALEAMQGGTTPLVSVYYELVDQVGHRFMHLAPPKRPDASEADFAAFSGAVDAAYELQDRLLGEIVAKAPRNAVVIVVSDHGFLSGSDRPAGTADVEGQPAKWHRMLGVFAAAGPPVEARSDLGIVGVEDVAPTVLHLLGLPMGEDMKGKPRLALDQPAFAIRSYDEVVRRSAESSAPSSEQLDAVALEELQALGYVGAQAAVPAKSAVAEVAGLATTAAWHVNRGISLLEAGRADEAAAEAREALDRDAASSDAFGLMSQALEAKGDLGGAVDAVRRAESIEPARMDLVLREVELLVKAGRSKEATLRAASLKPDGAASAAALTARGVALRSAGDSAGAVRALRDALAADVTFAPAVVALLPIAQERGALADLEPLLRQALAENDALPVHRQALGALLLATGRASDAVPELRAAVELDPTATMARARLSMALMAAKDLDAAVSEAQGVRLAQPKEAEAWVMIGSVFARADQLELGLECLVKGRSLGAKDAALDVAEAVTRVQLGDAEGAVRVLRDGLARHPDDPTLNELAFEFRKQGVIGP